jgi:hypothetical protein
MPCITHETEQERREAARRHEQLLTGPLLEEIDVLKLELAERDAMLCGVLTALTEIDAAHHMEVRSNGMALNLVANAMPVWYDGSEAGVPWEMVERWWQEHQEQDRRRREQEAQEREQRRRKALSKLTREERELLGIKE